MQNSDKKKLMVVGCLLLVAAYLLYDTYFAGSNNSTINRTHSQSETGMITQKVIKETTIIKEPEIAPLQSVPVMTQDDVKFLIAVRNQEKKEQELKSAILESSIAKAKVDAKESNQKLNPDGAVVEDVTGGAMLRTTSSVNIGVSQTTEPGTDSNKLGIEQTLRDQQAFEGMSVASMSVTEAGIDVWLNLRGDLFHAHPGYSFNGFEVLVVNPTKIVVQQSSSGLKKTFTMNANSYKAEPVDPNNTVDQSGQVMLTDITATSRG